MTRHRLPDPDPLSGHGAHTLRVWRGMVVGRHGEDVFVELGPRMQGVIPAASFDEAPEEGDVFEFTLRGQEGTLWVLALREEKSLFTWESMEPGSIVQARVLRRIRGGLQLKIGKLHAFMPRSHTGLPRGRDTRPLVGRSLTCEVLEVDPERQRVVVSRRAVLRRERDEAGGQRLLGGLRAGELVEGRVTRIEPYGAFLAIGRGRTGLVHVSDLCHDRVEHPAERVELGQLLRARVLYIRAGGRRIGLGVKQLEQDPWDVIEERLAPGDLASGVVTRVLPHVAFVRLLPGIEGALVHGECGLPPRAPLDRFLRRGQEVAVRVLQLDAAPRRLALSLLHAGGQRVRAEEIGDWRPEVAGEHEARTRLGPILRDALESRPRRA